MLIPNFSYLEIMNKFFLAIKNNYLFLIALLIGVFAYHFYAPSPSGGKLCFDDRCFLVELAVNETQWQQGLMNRSFLPANKGMLFIFDQEKDRAMWMKNMKIPLDMIFMDKNLFVVSVVDNLQPCSENYCPRISAGQETLYVLEIGAGLTEKEKITVGQQAELITGSEK